MAYQSEAALEQQFIEQLTKQEYSTVAIPDYDALVENFKVQFEAFNAPKLDTPITDKEWERIFNLMLGKSVFQSAKILRDKFVLEREDGTKVYLSFFDQDHTKNIFQVTHQTTVVGKYVNRYDVTILVNGLPLIQVELKRRGIDIREAVNQVMRYKKHSYNGLYHFIQLFIVSNGVDTKYFANSDRDLMYSLAFFWTDFNNVRITNLKDFSISFLARDHIIKMLTRYTILNDTDKILMVMRPYQVYAVEALIRQATLTNRNAYIWHTTGAGKTLTSFKTAQILAANPNIKKVIFLVDRKDLDSQTTEEFNKFEAGSVDVTDRTDVLVRQMKDKNRQLIVTTMQKMANAVKRPQYEKVMDAYKDEKVVFIIDECHRSQFGDMHKDIVRHFRKAQFFGFTGTPRFEVNGKTEGKITQTTEMLFGECLHNYLIKDAIFDNNVLGFHIEYIKTMEGDFDWDDPTLADAIDIGELYMSDERMSLIANHIIQNHKAKTRNGQYTAIFAVSSIDALVKYYDIFKKIKHDLNISGIFSYGQNEDAEGKDEHSRDSLERIIKDYNEMYGTNFSTDTFSAYHKDISDRVKGKKTKSLDILIVVNMFLTGFDAKPLNTLYLDKNLVWHSLVQAYSRTNRIDKVTKQFGQIVTYRNIKKWQDEALTLFSGDGDPNEYLLEDYAYYLNQWMNQNVILRKITPDVEAAGQLQSEDEIRMFIMAFRALAKTLATLKTFSKFDWADLGAVMDENEYEGFKSWYLYYKDQTVNPNPKVPVPVDVDFDIELVRTDRINVVYILNLLKNAKTHTKTEEEKQQDVDLILREIERSDNEFLRLKKEVMRQFILTRFYDLPENADVMEAFNQFEKEQMQADMEEFAFDNQIDFKIVSDLVSAYTFSGNVSEDNIRERLMAYPLGLLKMTKLTKNVKRFIQDTYKKYKAEGETE